MNTQRDDILVMAMMALMGAIGSFAFICMLAGVTLEELGMLTVSGFVLGLFGILFAAMILFHLTDGHSKGHKI